MKIKRNLMFLCLSIIIIISGCDRVTNIIEEVKSETSTTFTNSRTKLLDKITYSEDTLCEEMLNKIFNAIESKDKEKIKDMFLVDENDKEIDDQIDLFLTHYSGLYDNIYDVGSDSSSSSYDQEKGESHTINDYFTLEIDGEEFYGLMTILSNGGYVIENTKLVVFELATKEAYDSKYYRSHSTQLDESGIFYQNSPELREGLIMVSDRMFKDLNVDRELTKDDILSMVSTNSGYDEFTKEIGPPDAMWENFDYYYFELITGLYAVIHINKDIIEYIYIANEDDKIETLWINENYIEVWGDYFEYLYVDRQLTAEQFLEYADENQNIKDLYEEFGPPSAEESFYMYYELDDGKFLMCHTSGILKEVYLVDTKNIIELLRDYDKDSSNIDEEYWEQQ